MFMHITNQLTNVHAVPGKSAKARLQLLMNIVDVWLKEWLQVMWNLLTHQTVF